MDRVSRRDVLVAGGGIAAASLAGCSGDGGNADPTDRGPITVDEVAFATGRPTGYGEYEPQPEATYGPDDVVWIYAALSDISGEPVEGEEESFEVEIEQHVIVDGPGGDAIAEGTDSFERTLSRRQLDAFYVGTDVLHAGTVSNGEYPVTFAYRDRVSETETTATATFQIQS